MKELLNEIDELLARLEDHTHGNDGEAITRLRGKIQKEVKEPDSLPLPQQKAYQRLLMRIYNEFKSAEWVSPIVEEIKEHIVYPIQEDGVQ